MYLLKPIQSMPTHKLTLIFMNESERLADMCMIQLVQWSSVKKANKIVSKTKVLISI